MSGGVDSSTLAYWAKKRYGVYGLTFNYGQLAAKETLHAKLVAETLGISLKKIDLSQLETVFRGVSPLCDRNMEMPPSFRSTLIVPFRNAIFLAVAVAYAVSIGAKAVFYGAHRSDAPFYPDCRKEFFEAFQEAARSGTATGIVVDAPFHNMAKSEIVKLGKELNVPFELTWSCYLDGDKHCGKCESCVNRKTAFKEAAVEDPTSYQA
jgi:7-cyano-7-deazaguanine synthase